MHLLYFLALINIFRSQTSTQIIKRVRQCHKWNDAVGKLADRTWTRIHLNLPCGSGWSIVMQCAFGTYATGSSQSYRLINRSFKEWPQLNFRSDLRTVGKTSYSFRI